MVSKKSQHYCVFCPVWQLYEFPDSQLAARKVRVVSDQQRSPASKIWKTSTKPCRKVVKTLIVLRRPRFSKLGSPLMARSSGWILAMRKLENQQQRSGIRNVPSQSHAPPTDCIQVRIRTDIISRKLIF